MSERAVRTKLSGDRRQRFYRREMQRNDGKLVCMYCDKQVYRGHADRSLLATIEHVVPLALGGSHRKENMAIACYPCNHNRGKELGHKLNRRSLTFKLGEVA